MASASGQEEFLAVIRKSQEAVIAAVRNLAETVRTASPKLASVYAPLTDNRPKLPSVSVPFADKLPGPEDAVASAFDFAGQLLASQRKFAEDLLRAKPEGAVASTYDFAEQLLASQRKFAEDLLKAAAPLAPGRAESAPTTETYKPGQSFLGRAVGCRAALAYGPDIWEVIKFLREVDERGRLRSTPPPRCSRSIPAGSVRRSATTGIMPTRSTRR